MVHKTADFDFYSQRCVCWRKWRKKSSEFSLKNTTALPWSCKGMLAAASKNPLNIEYAARAV